VPGPTVPAAIEAFLDPLKIAASCLGDAHFTLTARARGDVGETHAWTLNRDTPTALGNRLSFQGVYEFETLDLGRSRKRERFRVTTREYICAVSLEGKEVIAAHWHPVSSSLYKEPHWHIGASALSEIGIHLTHAPISPARAFHLSK
jgi:hypothetical protein